MLLGVMTNHSFSMRDQSRCVFTLLLVRGLMLVSFGFEGIECGVAKDSFNADAWIQEFMDLGVGRGYRVDFIPAYDYVRRSTLDFLMRFKALYE